MSARQPGGYLRIKTLLTQASLGEQREGTGAVRDRMLGIGLHLAEGHWLPVGDEHRIIAETFAPARRAISIEVLERIGVLPPAH